MALSMCRHEGELKLKQLKAQVAAGDHAMEVLPADVIRVIGGYLPAPYYVVLMGVSKRLRSIFTPLR